MSLRILFLHKQILFPRDTGGKIRALNVLQHLAADHEITYACNLRPGEEQHLAEMQRLGLRMETVAGEPSRRGSLRFYADAACNVLSRRPFSVNRNYDGRLRARVAELLRDETYDVLICDCAQMVPHARGLRARVNVLFQHNVEAQILQRHAEVAMNPLKRLYMRVEHAKMARFERDCGRHFDRVIAVSERDRQTFEMAYGWKHVAVIDTAVDTDYFQPCGQAQDGDRVTFIGSMDWMPNQDGVKFFVDSVWPLVRQLRPSARFQIVGRSPPAEIAALQRAAGVEVLGGVPDVRPYLRDAAVVVVPLLVGGGTRLKIYEAMASGRAVVSTAIGAEGLPLTPGEHFLQADHAEAFAAAVVNLLEDRALRERLGRTADRFVRDRFGSATVARQFEAICISALEARTGPILKEAATLAARPVTSAGVGGPA
ncbi:MAG: glycosyltransferase [Planctomycetaceae bacterium]